MTTPGTEGGNAAPQAADAAGPVPFALVGAGWRAAFFLRVAAALPHRFRCVRALVRDEAKGRAFEASWGVPTVRTLGALADAGPAFAVLSVPRAAVPGLLGELAALGLPVLCETPPAADLDGLLAAWRVMEGGRARVQVAEQYPFQPLHAARLALIGSGRLGEVRHAQISAAHGYHGMALLRRTLGIGFEAPRIAARLFRAPLVAGPGRDGPPQEHRVAESEQVIATLDWDGRLGVHDFSLDQYFSWVRGHRFLARGDRGELDGLEARWLLDHRTPLFATLRRDDAGQGGNLEGQFHRGYLLGGEWLYRNPFAPARLADDEVAVAHCLDRMARYAAGGAPFYGLAEAAQDQWLNLCIERARATGEAVTAEAQPWASAGPS